MRHSYYSYLFFIQVVLASLFVLTQGVLAAPPCGEPLDFYRDIPSRSNGIYHTTEISCDGRGIYGLRYQCVEYIRRFYAEAFDIDTNAWRFNAVDFFVNAESLGLITFDNGGSSPPLQDDIIVFAGPKINSAGHIAIVTRVTSNSVHIIEQNWSTNGTDELELSEDNGTYRVIRSGSSYTVLGWLRKAVSITGGTYFDRNFGLIGTGFLFNPNYLGSHIPFVDVQGPPSWNLGNILTCFLFQPLGIASNRSICWDVNVPPITGDYTAQVEVSGQMLETDFFIDSSSQLSAPQITGLVTNSSEVALEWTAPSEAGSFLVRVNPIPFTGVTGELVLSGDTRNVILTGLPLVSGTLYQAVVFAFSNDVKTPGGISSPFNIGAHGVTFIAPSNQCPCDFDIIPKTAECWNSLWPDPPLFQNFTPTGEIEALPPPPGVNCSLSQVHECEGPGCAGIDIGVQPNFHVDTGDLFIPQRCYILISNTPECGETRTIVEPLSLSQRLSCYSRLSQYAAELAEVVDLQPLGGPYNCLE